MSRPDTFRPSKSRLERRADREVLKYFAYGSNMDGDRLRERGVRFYKRERGVLEGYRLVFNKRSSKGSREGYANIIKEEGSVVEASSMKSKTKI